MGLYYKNNRNNDDFIPYITDETILKALREHPDRKDDILHAADAFLEDIFGLGDDLYDPAEVLDKVMQEEKNKTLTEWLNKHLKYKAKLVLNPEEEAKADEEQRKILDRWDSYEVSVRT